MSDQTAVQLIPRRVETLTPDAARAWLADELPRWLDALKSIAMAGRKENDTRGNAACSLINELEALIVGCATVLDTASLPRSRRRSPAAAPASATSWPSCCADA